ncbi:hypothetical protein PAMP_022809 [Pampus punctatissimus]
MEEILQKAGLNRYAETAVNDPELFAAHRGRVWKALKETFPICILTIFLSSRWDRRKIREPMFQEPIRNNNADSEQERRFGDIDFQQVPETTELTSEGFKSTQSCDAEKTLKKSDQDSATQRVSLDVEKELFDPNQISKNMSDRYRTVWKLQYLNLHDQHENMITTILEAIEVTSVRANNTLNGFGMFMGMSDCNDYMMNLGKRKNKSSDRVYEVTFQGSHQNHRRTVMAILDKATSHTKSLLQKSEEMAKALEKQVKATAADVDVTYILSDKL